MKSAAYHGPHGKGDHVTFIKGQDPRAESSVCDRVYVTTLFSVEYRKIGETIDYALKLVGGRADRVFVGGIAASLMTERFKTEARWRGVRFISGLLTQQIGRAHVELQSLMRSSYAVFYLKKKNIMHTDAHKNNVSTVITVGRRRGAT